MQFEWDPKKAAENLKTHRVSFEFATAVFNDPLSIENLDDRFDYGEDRIIRIGQAQGELLTVVYVERENATPNDAASPCTKAKQHSESPTDKSGTAANVESEHALVDCPDDEPSIRIVSARRSTKNEQDEYYRANAI